MPEFLGRNAVLTFVSTSFGRFTTIDSEESVELADKSAGADTHDSFLAGIAKGSFSLNSNLNAGDTATWAAVVPGAEGTLVYSPEGTATGKPKNTAVAIVENRQQKTVFNEVQRMTVAFRLQTVITVGTW